jgi:hypothetical protein
MQYSCIPVISESMRTRRSWTSWKLQSGFPNWTRCLL